MAGCSPACSPCCLEKRTTGALLFSWRVIATAAFGQNVRTQRNQLPKIGAMDAVIWTGTQFVAVGIGGAVETSPNSNRWHGGAAQDLNAVTSSGSQYVAVGRQGVVLTSPDGTNWTDRSFVSGEDLTSSQSRVKARSEGGLQRIQYIISDYTSAPVMHSCAIMMSIQRHR